MVHCVLWPHPTLGMCSGLIWQHKRQCPCVAVGHQVQQNYAPTWSVTSWPKMFWNTPHPYIFVLKIWWSDLNIDELFALGRAAIFFLWLFSLKLILHLLFSFIAMSPCCLLRICWLNWRLFLSRMDRFQEAFDSCHIILWLTSYLKWFIIFREACDFGRNTVHIITLS